MRDMSGRTGVPIEPPEQTELLNACLDVPGVVGGGVPGGQFPFSFIEYSRH
jgi:phosphomevalonate kinase